MQVYQPGAIVPSAGAVITDTNKSTLLHDTLNLDEFSAPSGGGLYVIKI